MRPKGLEVLGLNTSNTADETMRVIRDMKLSFPMAMDQGGNLSHKLKVVREPCLLLVGRNHRIIKSWQGYSFDQIRLKAATLGIK